jgi:hypothetical protein
VKSQRIVSEELTRIASFRTAGLSFTAVQEQPGLRFERRDGPVEGLRFDRVDRPTED